MSEPDTQFSKPPPEKPVAVSEPSRAGALEILPCWAQLGIYGDSRCPELARYIHCRNCPVYSRAGVQLLNRPMPPDYRREWTEHFAREKKLAAACDASALIFRLQTEWLGLPTTAFQEVAEHRPIHSLPHRSRSLALGLANVRGELQICVSLGHALQLEPLPPPHVLRSTYHRLLVANWGGHRLAFPVDAVLGTHRFRREDLLPPPTTLKRSNQSFTQGLLRWQEQTVGFLDANLLFSTVNSSLS